MKTSVVALFLVLSCHPLLAELRDGASAPSFSLKLLDDTNYSLGQSKGKVVILQFWATWCESCLQDFLALQVFWEAHKSENLDILALSVDDSTKQSEVKSILQKHPFKGAMYNSQTLGRIRRVPTILVVDRGGIAHMPPWPQGKILDRGQLETFVAPYLKATQ